MLKILEKVLEREDIGIEDNFYQIGGDSLLVAKLITEIRENVLEVKGLTFETLMKLFTKNPTVRALASQVVDQKNILLLRIKKK